MASLPLSIVALVFASSRVLLEEFTKIPTRDAVRNNEIVMPIISSTSENPCCRNRSSIGLVKDTDAQHRCDGAPAPIVRAGRAGRIIQTRSAIERSGGRRDRSHALPCNGDQIAVRANTLDATARPD